MRIESELRVCGDCLQYLANGPAELEAEAVARIEAGTAKQGGDIVLGGLESEADADGGLGFSWHACELCESQLGGDRYAAAVLVPESDDSDLCQRSGELEGGRAYSGE